MKRYSIIKYFQQLTGLLIIFNLWSCSMTFEKRHYRPGYHINYVKKHQRNHPIENNPNLVRETRNHHTLPSAIIENGISPTKSDSVFVKINTEPTKESTTFISKTIKKQRDGTIHQYKRSKKNLELKAIKTLKKRKKTAWILGGLGIGFAVLGIFGLVFLGYVGLGGIAGGFLGIALVFAIIALIVRFKKGKDEPVEELKEKPYPPVSSGFKNFSFIFSIVIASMALIGLTFGFFIYPFGFIGFAISIFCTTAAIVLIGMGIRAILGENSMKVKLILIFSSVALILAILGMILFFL
jgi:hypothetical protein